MKCPLFEAAPVWPWVEGGPPMLYAAAAVERAMKVQEVICRVLAGTLTWLQGADILGIHTRSLRRWRARYERDGVLGLLRWAPRPALAPQSARRGGPAHPAPVSRALRAARRAPRLQRAALLPPRPARSRRDPVLHLRQARAARGRPRPQGAHPGPPSAPPRAAPVLRRAPAPRRQPPCLARAVPGRAADPHRRPGRRRPSGCSMPSSGPARPPPPS